MMAEFLIATVLLVALAKLLAEGFERIGLVSLLGEFSAGLILGTSVLGLIHPETVQEFATIGVILLLFLAGYEETNTSFLFEEKQRLSIIAVTGLVLTLGVLFGFSVFVLDLGYVQAAVFTFTFTLTDVAVGAKALLSTGKAGTRVGKSLLGLAVIDTVLGIILLAVTVTIISATSLLEIQKTIGGIVLFFLLVVLIGRYLPTLIKKAEEMKTEETRFSLALLTVFLLAFIAEELRLAAVLGAYFAGIVLQRSNELESHHFSETMKSIAYGFFVPLFFAWIGLRVDLWLIPQYIDQALLIAAVALGVKFTIVAAVSLIEGESRRDAMIYGMGLIPKGADNLVVLAIGESLGVLGNGMYEMLLVSMTVVMLVSILISSGSLNVLLSTE